jgi:hypothetical protein
MSEEISQHHLNVIQALRATVQEYCQETISEDYRYDAELENHYFGSEEEVHIVLRLLGGFETDNFEDGKIFHDVYEVSPLNDDSGNDFAFRFEEEDENISGLSRRVSIYGDCDEADAENIEAIFWEQFAIFH